MKKFIAFILSLCLILACFVGCETPSNNSGEGSSSPTSNLTSESLSTPESPSSSESSTESESDWTSSWESDSTSEQLSSVNFDFYAFNDLHGNIIYSDRGEGIAKTSTYLKDRIQKNPNTLILSSGDMWQGSAESNMTRGELVTDWMDLIGFTSMTLGNHEFDWGQKTIRENSQKFKTPVLAINVYDTKTKKRVDYCQPSVMVERSGVKVGIIGAVGDIYSSISSSQVQGLEFLTGSRLSTLVKNESKKLKEQGADIIVYSLHDGYDSNIYSGRLGDDVISAYYDTALSKDYVDLVFEAHTHKKTIYTDSKGVYHLQAGGYNEAISHVNLNFDRQTKDVEVVKAEIVYTRDFKNLAEDEETVKLFDKYADKLEGIYDVIGTTSRARGSSELKQKVADLYLSEGINKWGDDYDIFLGGGYISCRYPYTLEAGEVTYADLYSLFPFDNNVVLCSILGEDLLNRFVSNEDSNYYISYSSIGQAGLNSIDAGATYYVVVDTFSSDYSPNNLTVIDTLSTQEIYARDLLKKYIAQGNWA